MAFSDSLAYLYGLQHFGIKLGLENIRTLLDRLGRPQDGLRIVHVAGTNGKGSTAVGIAAIATAAGHRCGLYTSPHLQSFTERIRIDGAAISEPQVVELTEAVRAVVGSLPITFFEFTTAMALLHFHRQRVALAVVETGMGGRLDATNVVAPLVTVITPVSRDHVDHLGGELAAIATEKAGILKPGVPLVLARQPEAVAVAIEAQARVLGVPLYRLGVEFDYVSHYRCFDYAGLTHRLNGLRPGLEGRHQQANLSLSLAAVECLEQGGMVFADAALRAGAEQVRWPGRLEWWGAGRNILLDGAHNAASAEALAGYLRDEGVRQVILLAGVKADKPLADVLGPLLPFCREVYACPATCGETHPPAAIARFCASRSVPCHSFDRPEAALRAARCAAAGTMPLLVAGSLYLLGEVRALLSMSEEGGK